MKLIALLIFIAVYALMLLLPTWRAAAALAAAAAFVLIGIVPVGEVAGAVDWNVLLMLAGTMGTVDLFIRSNMPNRLSDRLVSVLPSVKWLIIALALFAGLVSAFVDNVATVLMLAPVGLAISKKLNISPVQPILAIGGLICVISVKLQEAEFEGQTKAKLGNTEVRTCLLYTSASLRRLLSHSLWRGFAPKGQNCPLFTNALSSISKISVL